MKNKSPHDWGNIAVLWSCMFVAVTVTIGWMNDTMYPLGAALILLSVAAFGAELVGRE